MRQIRRIDGTSGAPAWYRPLMTWYRVINLIGTAAELVPARNHGDVFLLLFDDGQGEHRSSAFSVRSWHLLDPELTER